MDLQPIVFYTKQLYFHDRTNIKEIQQIPIAESGSTYEVYVAGVNSAGVGESSTRIVFR